MSALDMACLVLERHPSGPVGQVCPTCASVGLPENRMPCGARVAASRVVVIAEAYRLRER